MKGGWVVDGILGGWFGGDVDGKRLVRTLIEDCVD